LKSSLAANRAVVSGPIGEEPADGVAHTRVLPGLIVGEKQGRRMWWRVEPTQLASDRAAPGG
jgi:hypothetical protein